MRALILILLLAACAGPPMPQGCPGYFDEAGRNAMFEAAVAQADLDQMTSGVDAWFNCLPPAQQCEVLDVWQQRVDAQLPGGGFAFDRPAHCA